MKKIVITLLAVFAATLVTGQTQPFVEANLRFIANERIDGLFIQTRPSVAGQPLPKHELKAGTHSRSESARYQGPQTLTIFQVATGENQRELLKPVATTQLPENTRDVLIALVEYRGQDGVKRYIAQAYDDSMESFPKGSLRILNMTPVSLSGRIGNSTLEVPAGVSLLPAIPSAANSHLALGYMLAGQAYAVSDQAYQTETDERVLITLLPPFHRGNGTIRARVIRDSGHQDLTTAGVRVAQRN